MARVVWMGEFQFSHSRAVKLAVLNVFRGDFELRLPDLDSSSRRHRAWR